MLTLIKLSGWYLSDKRHQINKINYYIEKINKYSVTDHEKALNYAIVLTDYLQKLTDEKRICRIVELWCIENPPESIIAGIERDIANVQLKKNILKLSETANLPKIYTSYNGKDSFRTLIEKELQKTDEACEVVSLQGGNNPIARVNYNGKLFIVRFLRVNREEEQLGHSPRVARELLDDVKQIPQPYLIEEVTQETNEITYLEYGEYYEKGNLEDHFKRIHRQHGKKLISNHELEKEILIYAIRIVEFFIIINAKNIWFTDLKPTNILLNLDGEIVFSDIKGLLLSTAQSVHSSRANLTREYYQSTVFKKNQINLELLQRQTLATTLYQLACNELPKQVGDQVKWSTEFSFNKHKIFTGVLGEFLIELITDLNRKSGLSMNQVLNKLVIQLDNAAEDRVVLLEDPIDLPPPRRRRPGGNYVEIDSSMSR